MIAFASADLAAQIGKELAERVGFEPTVAFATRLFESRTLNHSDTSPGVARRLEIYQARRRWKNPDSKAAASSANTPRSTLIVWLLAGWSSIR